MKGMIIVKNEELKIDNEFTYCDDYGNIYSINFIKKKDVDSLVFENFINEVLSSNLDLLACGIKNFSTNELVKSFKNCDVKKLNTLYIACKNIQGDAYNISDIILNYFRMFFDYKSKMFCTSKEATAFMIASIQPVFANQNSEVIRKIENADNGYLIKDILNKNIVSKNLVKSISK